MEHPDHYIELVELFPCYDKDQLEKREGEIIRSLSCVNKNIPRRNIKQSAPSQVKLHKRVCKNSLEVLDWRPKNKESERFRCYACDIHFGSGGQLARHEATDIHKTNWEKCFTISLKPSDFLPRIKIFFCLTITSKSKFRSAASVVFTLEPYHCSYRKVKFACFTGYSNVYNCNRNVTSIYERWGVIL